MARTPRTISARVRILSAILAVAAIGLAVVGSVTFIVQREQLLREVDVRLVAQVDSIRALAGDTAATGDEVSVNSYESLDAFIDDAVTLLAPGRNAGAAVVVDGRVVASAPTSSSFDAAGDAALLERAQASAEQALPILPRTVVTPNGTLRYIAVPIVGPEGDRAVYVRATDLDAELAPVTTAIATYWIAAVVVLASIGIVGWFVMGRLLSPIRQIRETADAITIGDLSSRLPAQGNDEISDLTRTVNSMLDRIEGSVDVQRQLLDDVRHELKTPITIVRGHLEMMDPRDVDDVETAREIGIAELDRMTRLVEDIDLLAAAEGDQFDFRNIDLAVLTARVGELVTVIPDHTWSVESLGEGTVSADQDRLLQAWLQLADNAAKYTPEGSPIEIGSSFVGGDARLWVRDHGAGIPPSLRHRIFRRFDRAHGKRSVGGSGLGLAIVDAITKAHGGRCVVTDTPGGGATFTIHLPLPTSELPAPVRAGDVVLQREAAG